MSKGIVFFDIDGTLCRYAQRVDEAVKQSFRRFHENGNVAFLCTGRSPIDIQPDIWELGFDGMIGLMGAYIVVKNQVVQNVTIPRELVKESVDTLLSGKAQAYFLGRKIYARTKYAQDFNIGVPVVHEYHDLCAEGEPPELSSFDLDFDKVEDIEPFLEVLGKHSEFLQYDGHTGQTRVLGVNKSSAIEKVLSLPEYRSLKSYAIGDSQNDMEMLRFVDVGIAMGDAPKEVVSCARWRTAVVEENGVGKALERFGLI